ncbi:nucleotidyltransferase domain-containing protein [Mucilaginibacter sp. SMC90]|uniref:nucleotidyltransferase domain-containing protein n=1 Tax=Mucilaginibacter sp. SMC90 TaxID=2929803 RepID=UPI001FB29AEC|nr:nucleotidyltransferase domain-containing protein [Mucilaginibacter sp. SMC90]UOE46997.1 nucleotidyltransferase domain-containing protein [Mucilaginibacter sp. SMC90]
MKQTIQQKLLELEQTEDIKILYACESGSRAWGFASPDSDFDVRFIYARPVNYYLGITDSSDFIDLPINEVLDIRGWDIRKALKLFLKSNISLFEWVQSPIVYREDSDFADEIRSIMPEYFSLRAAANHYSSLAFNTLQDDLQANEVKLKRYFYALRSTLACLWIVDRQTVPPMEFCKLRDLINDRHFQDTVDDLLVQKQTADEKTLIKPVPLLQTWLQDTLTYCKERIPLLPSEKKQPDELNQLFRKYIL